MRPHPHPQSSTVIAVSESSPCRCAICMNFAASARPRSENQRSSAVPDTATMKSRGGIGRPSFTRSPGRRASRCSSQRKYGPMRPVNSINRRASLRARRTNPICVEAVMRLSTHLIRTLGEERLRQNRFGCAGGQSRARSKGWQASPQEVTGAVPPNPCRCPKPIGEEKTKHERVEQAQFQAAIRSESGKWSEWQDLNLRPPRPERGALPD